MPEVNKPVSPVRKTPATNRASAANNVPASNSPAANKAPAANTSSAADSAPAANAADPAANVRAASVAPTPEKKNHFMGFFEGFVSEGVETLGGLYTLATTNPLTTAKGLVYMATHPAQAVQAITEPYTTAYKQGNYGELAGRVGFQVLTVVVTSGALSKGSKAEAVAKPTANMTATATKVTEDLAQKIGTKQAIKELAGSGLKGAAYNKKLASLTAQYTEKYAGKLAARGITDKLATSFATSGIGDDALSKIMAAGGKNVGASEAYRFGTQALRAGMKPDAIAAELAKFGISKKAASQLPVATKLMAQQGTNAALIAGAGATKSAEKIASQLGKLERLAAATTDDALKAGYKAQIEALKAATAAHPRTAALVEKIAAGQKIGSFERIGASIGSGIDDIGAAGGKVVEGGKAVKVAMSTPNTIGGYVQAIGNIPVAIGSALDAAYQGAVATLKKGIQMLPKIELPTITWEKVAATRVPSPWEILTAPVAVPFKTAAWAIKNPVRALGAAGIVGDLGNAAKTGENLAAREASERTPDADPSFRYYELKDGDTLEDIARRELGDAKKWEQIYQANKELFDSLADDQVLPVGTKLRIPVEGAPASQAPTSNAPAANAPAADAPAANDPAAAGAYKTGLLKLIEAELAAATDDQNKQLLTQLKAQLGAMSPEEAYALKPELEARGLVVSTAPTANTPKPNAPAANTSATNTPGANQPAATQTNTPGANQPAAPQTYTTVRGDTLWGIAENKLGQANRWPEIADLNAAKYPSLATTPDFLGVGWKLDLPKAPAAPKAPAVPAAPAAPSAPPVGNTNGNVVRPGPTAPAAPVPPTNLPAAPSGEARTQIVKQFNLTPGDQNFNKFWGEVSQYPTTTVGPDTGTEADRRGLQNLLNKFGYDVPVTGDYFVSGPDGSLKRDASGQPVSPTAEAVVHFKRLAGITQGYQVVGPDGKPTADVNEYVDTRTREAMGVALRLLQNPAVRSQGSMEAAVREAGRLQSGAIGPETGTRDARVLVQRYLSGLGYEVPMDGAFDQKTIDAIVDFKKKNHIAAGYKDDAGNAVYTPYVDGRTADALYNAITKMGAKR